MEPMTTVAFYTKFDSLAAEHAAFNVDRTAMKDSEVALKELDLTIRTNTLFAEYVGTQLDIFA